MEQLGVSAVLKDNDEDRNISRLCATIGALTDARSYVKDGQVGTFQIKITRFI